MKLKLILILSVFTLAFGSCKKCETCVPHLYSMGVIDTSADNATPTVKLCDKRDIDAYESLTTFTDAASTTDTVRFICQ